MNKGIDVPDLDAKRLQYEILQSRIALHGNRMWQLPLTYLGAIAVALSIGEEGSSEAFGGLWFLGLSAFGVILMWALYGAFEGYDRTAKNMNELESELGLSVYTKSHIAHSLPYFLLMLFGIVACFLRYSLR